MKLNPVGQCAAEAIKYITSNFIPLTLLILQILVLTLVVTMGLNYTVGNDLFVAPSFTNLDSALLTIPVFIAGAFITFTLALAPSLVIYRQVVLGEPFEMNLIQVIIQKRFWYGLWANIKVGFVLFLVTIGLLLVLLATSLIVSFITHISDSGSFNPFEVFQDNPLKYFFFSAFFVLILGVVYLAYACVIYVPLLAYIDKKASFTETWQILKGHKLFIFGLLIIVSFLPLFVLTLVQLILTMILQEASGISLFWLNEAKSLIGLYFNVFFVASIAFSYQKIMKPQK